jgi:hypothetical protein
LERTGMYSGERKNKKCQERSDSILAEAIPTQGTVQLIPNLKYLFSKDFVLERAEYIPGSAKTKKARALATAFCLKPPPSGNIAANPVSQILVFKGFCFGTSGMYSGERKNKKCQER